MVLLTLVFGSLSCIANDQFMETKTNIWATSSIAWLSYGSILCAIWMFYFSVDIAFVKLWWYGYLVLCALNAVWNAIAVQWPRHRPHVGVNAVVAVGLLIALIVHPLALSTPEGFYSVLLAIGIMKWWQRRHTRFQEHENRVARKILMVAHGGALNPSQANSIEGIRNSLEKGVDGIEIDVQVTQDGQPVLFHDSWLCLNAERKRISDLTLDEFAERGRPLPLLQRS